RNQQGKRCADAEKIADKPNHARSVRESAASPMGATVRARLLGGPRSGTIVALMWVKCGNGQTRFSKRPTISHCVVRLQRRLATETGISRPPPPWPKRRR